MKHWKKGLMVLALAVMAVACTEETEKPFKMGPTTPVAKDRSFSTDFNLNAFESNDEVALLKELKLCDPTAPNDTDEKRPSCSPKFFRFFKLNEKTPLKDGFMLLIKAGVNGFPLRRLLVFERERGDLVKLNGFNGNLIETRKAASGYDDLVIRFPDNIDGELFYYNCLFQWNGAQYAYKQCEVIDQSRVKPQYIDSMAVEIKKILDEKKLIF